VRLLVLATLLALTAPAVAGGRQGATAVSPVVGSRATKVAGRHCPEAGRAIVSVPAGFDGVRVVVAETLPGAAVDVTVMVGAADRRVRAWGGGAWSLQMDEAPTGPVLVAVEPSLDAPLGACVERVELLRHQQVVANIRLH
jgi:hypothetical protein